MEEKNITEQESLTIIQNMMNKTKEQLFDNSNLFLLWGFAAFICTVAQYILIKINVQNSEAIWIAMPIIAIIHIYIVIKQRSKMKVETYNGNAISALWTAIGFAFVCMVFFASQKINILPMIILLYAIGTFVSGKIIDFKPLIIGGSICFLLSIAIAFIKDENQLLIMAAAILISYIIPGFLLKKEFKNQEA
ncbi:MAG TPA: hypothetical protein PK431_10325 [Chitinophagales bacterium]|nr:hypothetical protein [Chitinophagales bacterium]